MAAIRPVGEHVRRWRQLRRMSQLDLALEAEISQKHLSFVESGRSIPSRDMILHLAERLALPLRDRNVMLLAAGYAPSFPERGLDDPALRPARRAMELILRAHEPFPALAIDKHWTMVAANAAVAALTAGVEDEALLNPPVNVLRLSLHPRGLAPRIVNLAAWRHHLLERLRQQIAVGGDPVLIRMLNELSAYPGTATDAPPSDDELPLAVPLRLRVGSVVLSLISCTTVFGTPLDVTLSELALESFFPADAATAESLAAMAAPRPAAAMPAG